MIRPTRFGGTPATQAALLADADNVPSVVLALIVFPPLWKEYREAGAGL